MKRTRITVEKNCGLDSKGLVTPEWDSFTQACNAHDQHYDDFLEGGWHHDTSETVDLQFWNDMQDYIDAAPWWKRVYLKPRQYVYYGLARIYGKWRWRR